MNVASGSPRSTAACCATIGSRSTYTTLVSGRTSRTTSCVLPTVNSPQPMSRNWLMPWSAIQRAAR